MKKTLSFFSFFIIVFSLGATWKTGKREMATLAQYNNFSKMQEIIESKCIDCHDVDDMPLLFDEEATYINSGLVTPGNPEESILFARLKKDNWDEDNYGALDGETHQYGKPNMPRGRRREALSSEELKIIFDWITGLSSDSGIKIENQETEKSIVNYSLRTGGRKFLANKLKSLFGPSSIQVINSHIFNKISEFGSSCDLYEMKECRGRLDGTRFDLYSQPTTSSEAWRVQTCEKLTENTKAVTYFWKKTTNGESSAGELVLEDVANAYQLFYPGQNIDTQTEEKFFQAAKKFKNPKSGLVLILCLTPDWQIP